VGLPLLPLAMAVRAAGSLGTAATSLVGELLSLLALICGAVFFAYAARHYLALLAAALAVLGSAGWPVGGNGNGRQGENGNGGERNGNGLARINHHGENGNGNGRTFDLGRAPFVSVHIASYNEKRVLGRLLEACAALDYPAFEVIVVDDSTDAEAIGLLDPWRRRPGFLVLSRPRRDGFKGGALAEALRHTDPRAEFVVVFDADAVPFPDTIRRFLPHFFEHEDGEWRSRPAVAAVQSYQWHVLNKSESWLTDGVRAEYAGSYMVERPFQELIDSLKMVAGTAFMIRADVLREVGWTTSLTEDWELTLRLYSHGWKVAYTPYAETPAECVSTFARLARQRMRWAEGHTSCVRRYFVPVLLSTRVGLVAKLDFLYYAGYYLQSALFVAGTLAWLFAEIVLRTRLPEWTALFGWALLLSNALSLPLMNAGGLILERAPGRDLRGVASALLLSYLLIPFQAWAALKGLIESEEGPWYRTPKTGRVTEAVGHLGKFKLRRRRQVATHGSAPKVSRAGRPTGPGSRRGAALLAAGALALGLLGLRAWQAPPAAAASGFYLHSGGLMDETTPAGSNAQTVALTSTGVTATWASTTTYPAQTIPTGTYTFTYWATGGIGASATAALTFGYSSTQTCGTVTTIALASANVLTPGSGNTSTFIASVPTVLPGNEFLCFTISVASVAAGGITLDYDSASQPTNLGTPAITVPALGLLLLAPCAVLVPVLARHRRTPGAKP
jgi:cellulose synthase/poly-beta-1,6-N-acetylglucosamine synthase-like glycosyltransferase